jgi:hypothetical protein
LPGFSKAAIVRRSSCSWVSSAAFRSFSSVIWKVLVLVSVLMNRMPNTPATTSATTTATNGARGALIGAGGATRSRGAVSAAVSRSGSAMLSLSAVAP